MPQTKPTLFDQAVQKMMERLAQKRPIFHSEADFQFALAWEIRERNRERNPALKVRLEYPFADRRSGRKRSYLDIFVEGGIRLAIELKYKTKPVSGHGPIDVDGEKFWLKNHQAQNQGQYDFVKDIKRLETAVFRIDQADAGLAILLTNDEGYQRAFETVPAFQLRDGRILPAHEDLAWSETAGPRTKKGREESIRLENKYCLCWHPFDKRGFQFHYLAIPVGELDALRRASEMFA